MEEFGRKRVLFVIPYLHEGGTERVLSNIETHFPNEWEIDTLINSKQDIVYPYRGNLYTLNIDRKPNTDSVFFQFFAFIKRIRCLKNLKRKNGYVACISFLDSANVANILSGQKYCKAIVSVRNSLIESSRLPQYKYIVNPLVKRLYNRANKIVAVSEGVRTELIEEFGLSSKKVTTIENGYDIELIKSKQEEMIEDELLNKLINKKVILSTGRLTDQKSQWHLIRAFSLLLEENKEQVLVIIGSGENEKYLKGLVADYNIENNVLFLGFVENPFKYGRLADVFVLPSQYEGFPNALAEAICMGIPCIATDFRSGARELLAPSMVSKNEKINRLRLCEYGVIVPMCSGNRLCVRDKLENEEKELARAIHLLLTERELSKRYMSACKERANNLSINHVIDKWMSVIKYSKIPTSYDH